MSPARKNEKRTDSGLAAAITAAGSRYRLAQVVGTSATAVLKWQRVPTHRIIQIEELLRVPREVLRPDLYRQERKQRR